MAVRGYVKDQAVTASTGDASLIRVMWTGLLNGDTGAPLPWAEWADRVCHFGCANYLTGAASVFGAGGNIVFEGSLDYDPVTNTTGTWTPLNDISNSALATITTTTLKQVVEAALWTRPRVSAGDGTTSLTVIVSARRVQGQLRGG
jgi:hypothetical protein